MKKGKGKTQKHHNHIYIAMNECKMKFSTQRKELNGLQACTRDMRRRWSSSAYTVYRILVRVRFVRDGEDWSDDG